MTKEYKLSPGGTMLSAPTPRHGNKLSLKDIIKPWTGTRLAAYLGIRPYQIYGWKRANELPGKHVERVAKFYGVDPLVVAQFITGLDPNADKRATRHLVRRKSPDALKAIVSYMDGKISEDEARGRVLAGGGSDVSMNVLIEYWGGDGLRLLYSVFEAYRAKELTPITAAKLLGTSREHFHKKRGQWGYESAFRPEGWKSSSPAELAQRKKNKASLGVWERSRHDCSQAVLGLIDGRFRNVELARREYPSAERKSIDRAREKVLPGVQFREVRHWHPSFRSALAESIKDKTPKLALTLVEYARDHAIAIPKDIRIPDEPANYRGLKPIQVLYLALYHARSLVEVAGLAGTDEGDILKRFEMVLRDYRELKLTW
jgi:hypothetical protein